VTKLVPEPLRWSRKHDGQNELLDHILASSGFMPRLGGIGLRQVPALSILTSTSNARRINSAQLRLAGLGDEATPAPDSAEAPFDSAPAAARGQHLSPLKTQSRGQDR
jgi:predicted extracellular nuclease